MITSKCVGAAMLTETKCVGAAMLTETRGALWSPDSGDTGPLGERLAD
jgi:hypothetical protein